MKPARVRSAVVFPQPEGPRRVKNSPGWTCRSRCGMAVKSPKVTSMFSKRIMATCLMERGNGGWRDGLRHVFEFDLLHPGAHVLLDEVPVDVLLLEAGEKVHHLRVGFRLGAFVDGHGIELLGELALHVRAAEPVDELLRLLLFLGAFHQGYL